MIMYLAYLEEEIKKYQKFYESLELEITRSYGLPYIVIFRNYRCS